MTNEEKIKLKKQYKMYKKAYYSLKKDIQKVPKDSIEEYEMLGSLTILGMQIANIRKALFDAKFRRFYLSTVLDNFIFEEKEVKGGR